MQQEKFDKSCKYQIVLNENSTVEIVQNPELPDIQFDFRELNKIAEMEANTDYGTTITHICLFENHLML